MGSSGRKAYLFIYLNIYLFIYLYICLFVYCSFVRSFIYLLIYFSLSFFRSFSLFLSLFLSFFLSLLASYICLRVSLLGYLFLRLLLCFDSYSQIKSSQPQVIGVICEWSGELNEVDKVNIGCLLSKLKHVQASLWTYQERNACVFNKPCYFGCHFVRHSRWNTQTPYDLRRLLKKAFLQLLYL